MTAIANSKISQGLNTTARVDLLAQSFAAHGFRLVEPAILQPLDVFIDLAGEDLRRRLFITASADGRE